MLYLIVHRPKQAYGNNYARQQKNTFRPSVGQRNIRPRLMDAQQVMPSMQRPHGMGLMQGHGMGLMPRMRWMQPNNPAHFPMLNVNAVGQGGPPQNLPTSINMPRQLRSTNFMVGF